MRSFPYVLSIVAMGSLGQGCGEDPPAASAYSQSPGAVNDFPSETPQGTDCESGAAEPCTCAANAEGVEESGTRYCYEGRWLACECFADVDLSGDCLPGRYEGDFWGLYNSSFTVVGVPIPVFSLSATTEPGLAFTLHSSGEVPKPGQEFVEALEISDGYVKGTADGLFPFEGKLTGRLNCETKRFEAILDGGYCLIGCVGVGVNQAAFEGPVVGYYDSSEKAFTKSTWSLLEETPLQGVLIDFGGEGEWSAKWVGPAGP